jgi:hypothetical protein
VGEVHHSVRTLADLFFLDHDVGLDLQAGIKKRQTGSWQGHGRNVVGAACLDGRFCPQMATVSELLAAFAVGGSDDAVFDNISLSLPEGVRFVLMQVVVCREFQGLCGLADFCGVPRSNTCRILRSSRVNV